MGFTVDEVAAGIERLLKRLGAESHPVREGEGVRFFAPGGVTIEVGPMPEERIHHPVFFPRTLLILRGEEDPVAALYERILHAFWRVGG